MTETDYDEIAEQIAAVLLKPLEAVGTMLAREIDKLEKRVSELEDRVDWMGPRE